MAEAIPGLSERSRDALGTPSMNENPMKRHPRRRRGRKKKKLLAEVSSVAPPHQQFDKRSALPQTADKTLNIAPLRRRLASLAKVTHA